MVQVVVAVHDWLPDVRLYDTRTTGQGKARVMAMHRSNMANCADTRRE